MLFNLNLKVPPHHTSESLRKEMAHGLREKSLCKVNRFYTGIRASSMSGALSLRAQGKEFFLYHMEIQGAVKTQVRIAISFYVLVVIVKKLLKLYRSLDTILIILIVNLFEKTPMLQAFSRAEYEKR